MMEELFKNRVYKFLRERNFEKAKSLIERALEENRENERAMEILGDIFMQMGKEEEAIRYYKTALELVQKRKNSFYEMVLYIKRKQIEGELKEINLNISRIAFETKLKSVFEKTVFNFLKGTITSLKFDQGREFIEELLDESPLKYEILAFYALTFNRTEQFKSFMEKSSLMFKEKGDIVKSEEINQYLGESGYDTEVLKDIIGISGIEERKLEPSGTLELAELLANIGSKEEAVNEYVSAIYGYIVAEKNIDKAKEILEKIKEIEPDDERIEKLKDYLENPPIVESGTRLQEPLLALERSINQVIEEEDLESVLNASKYFSTSSLHEDALFLFSILKEKNFDRNTYFTYYLFSLYETGEYEKIIEETENLFKENVEKELLQYLKFFRGLAFEKLGDKKKTLELFGEIYEESPDFLDIEERIMEIRKEEEKVEVLEEVQEEIPVQESPVSIQELESAEIVEEPLLHAKKELKERILILY